MTVVVPGLLDELAGEKARLEENDIPADDARGRVRPALCLGVVVVSAVVRERGRVGVGGCVRT